MIFKGLYKPADFDMETTERVVFFFFQSIVFNETCFYNNNIDI